MNLFLKIQTYNSCRRSLPAATQKVVEEEEESLKCRHARIEGQIRGVVSGLLSCLLFFFSMQALGVFKLRCQVHLNLTYRQINPIPIILSGRWVSYKSFHWFPTCQKERGFVVP